MKKILLATSALVAMSSVALAGGMVDTPAAPAPVAEGFTFTASGEAELFAFYTNDGATNATKTSGFGGDLDFNFVAARTFDDGSELTVEVDVDTNQGTGADAKFDLIEVEDFIIGYKSALGTLQIGTVEIDGHDVEVPEAPSIAVFEDDDDEDEFIDIVELDMDDVDIDNIANQDELRAGRVGDDLFKNMALTYASPEFGGFQLGLGVAKGAAAGDVKFDAVVAGSVTTGNVVVKVGAGYAADSGDIGKGTAKGGLSATMGAFTLGGNANYNLLTEKLGFEAGVEYAVDTYRIGAKYTVANGLDADKGIAVVGGEYDVTDQLHALASVGYDLAATSNEVEVYAGVVYTSDDYDVSVEYKSTKGADVAKGVAKAGVVVRAVENLELTVSGQYNLLTEDLVGFGLAEYQATSALKVILAGSVTKPKVGDATMTAKLGAEYAVTSKWTVDAAGMYKKAPATDAAFGGEAGASYEFAKDVSFDLKGTYNGGMITDGKAFGAKAGFSVEF